MTGILPLDWLMMALSLFNTMAIAWMGLTVLLNAERRTWGVWLVSVGMLAGALFFVSHSALLGLDLHALSPGMDFWWRIGWPLVSLLPLSWYVVTLWYNGYFDDPRAASRRRHLPWLIGVAILFSMLCALLLFANPLPAYLLTTAFTQGDAGPLSKLSLLLIVYVLYNVLSISLSLDALLNPGPSGRLMGNLARSRARPWLMGAALCYLLVSLMLAMLMFVVVYGANSAAALVRLIGGFDAAISFMIALAVILIGRALVSYEVFTGKMLPRRGLYRQWRNMVILGAGFGVVAGGAFALHAQPIYVLLLAAVIMTVFYALHNWRGAAEREQTMSQLRPFIAGQGLYEQIRAGGADNADAAASFHALCAQVLVARLAYLVPLGALAPLAGPGLSHPPGAEPPALHDITAQFNSPATMCVPLDPQCYGAAAWAVPLWGVQGLIGVLLLGDKYDGGLYSQEEIEIARAGGERLLDMQAGAEMARRLMALQRQRLAETQLLDQRARRILHDDVLPQMHAAMLELSGKAEAADAVALLADAHGRISRLLREITAAAAPDVAKEGVIGALRRVGETDLRDAFDRVEWDIAPRAEQKLRGLPPLTAEVVFYAAREIMRNAARYGRGGDATRPLHLRVCAASSGSLTLDFEDDGVGLRPDDTPDGAGNGGSRQGLALHGTMMAVIGGSLAVESRAGAGTRVVLSMPDQI